VNKGILYGLAGYFLWGVFPIYWKLLQKVAPLEILFHRMLWSLVFVIIILAIKKQWSWLKIIKQQPKIIWIFVLTAALLSLNWFTYIWAVNNGFIVEASLGYFINPLLNVALGVIFLKERLRLGQTLAIVLAIAGVIYLTVNYGAFPKIALILAFCFAFYGLLRKTAPLGSLEGFSIETTIFAVPALTAIIYFETTQQGTFLHGDPLRTILLIFAGAVTAIPLLLFSAAARRVTLMALGILQYIAPTLQFLIGVLVYAEPFNRTRFIGFCIIWTALAIYTFESLLYLRRLHRNRST
jgi:chloramphenicol-sensitive protein RarD